MSSSSSKCCESTPKNPPKAPDPNPFNYKFSIVWKSKNYLIVFAIYPGCTTYECAELIVFKDVLLEDLISTTKLDPHFTGDKISPIARFPYSEQGITDALGFAEMKTGIQPDIIWTKK